MIVNFGCPSAPQPIGGVTALYEYANGLSRRGHEVRLLHAPFFRNRITSLGELSWFSFAPGIEHRLVDAGDTDLPTADICFGTSDHADLGLPATFVQGFEMLHLGLERQAFRSPGLKVCVSHWLAEVGRRFGVSDDRCEVVPMGIDHHRYRITTPITDRPPRVGVLHHTHPAKGWEVARRALDRVHDRAPEVEVVAFGTAEPVDPLPDWISFSRDPAPSHLIETIYNGCQVFLQASDYEGFGFTAVEAMACGAALVTTDNGGSRDYAEPGTTALVAPPGDDEALATHVLALLDGDKPRQTMAHAGADLVRTRFRWDRAAADLEDCLERYLADPAPYLRPPGPELVPPGGGLDPFALR